MPEHQHLEWKESWRDEHLRWLCGFANAEGGTLVIGRHDHGHAVGVTNATRLLEEIPTKARDLLGIVVVVNLLHEGGHDLIEIIVEPYPTPISYHGEYHFRSGSTKLELRGAALSAFLLRKLGRHWDGAPLPGLAAAELDPTAFRRFRSHAARSGRLSEGALDAPDADLLERLHLTEGAFLKRAAALLFHPDPERFVTGACVKIGAFSSNADLRYHDEVHGDLFRQLDVTVDLLRTKYFYAEIAYEGMQRVETYPIPEAALREALLNALIHKDYAAGAPVQISVYADKLMIWNPGQLPPTWTAERLLQKHPSLPPNPDIANTFFLAGVIEAWGRGIEKIVALCRNAGMPEPLVSHDGTGLWLTFPFAARVAGQVTAQVRGQVAAQVTAQVSPEILRLLASLEGELTRAELQLALSLSSRRHFDARYLKPAIQLGLVALTLPDKPNSRLQRYRLTPEGLSALSALSARPPRRTP